MQEENVIYVILKRIRERQEQLKTVIANGIHSWDLYNKTVGEFKAYNIMEQELQDLHERENDGDTKT
jgi:hypothetical protein